MGQLRAGAQVNVLGWFACTFYCGEVSTTILTVRRGQLWRINRGNVGSTFLFIARLRMENREFRERRLLNASMDNLPRQKKSSRKRRAQAFYPMPMPSMSDTVDQDSSSVSSSDEAYETDEDGYIRTLVSASYLLSVCLHAHVPIHAACCAGLRA